MCRRQAHGQVRIVDQHGAGAGEDRAGTRAPAMHVASRRFAADPFRIARRHRAAAIEAGREFHPQPRPATFDPRQEAAVERARLRFHQAGFDHDAGGEQFRETAAIDLREWIAHRADHARDARGDQRIGARTGAAGMRAGFQGDVGGGATRAFASRLEREHLGVRPALALVEAFADDFAIAGDHAADHRVRPRGVGAAFGEPQRARHHGVVDGGEGRGRHQRFFLSACLSMGTTSPPSSGSWPSPGRSRSSRSSSSRKSATSSNERYTEAKRT